MGGGEEAGCDGDGDSDGGGCGKYVGKKQTLEQNFHSSQCSASGPPLSSPLVVSIDATAIIVTPSYTLHFEIHQMRMPTFATLPAPHRRLAIIHCHRHPPLPLPNAIFFAIASPPPHHWCPLPPLSNAIVILHCQCCCCCPSSPSNTDARCRHPPPLVSNAILASPSPRLSPLMLPWNAIKRYHCQQMPPSPPT